MGALELQLLLRYGVPLAVKLLAGGKSEKETVEAVQNTVSDLAKGRDAVEALLKADDKQVEGIVEGLFGVLTGVADALGNLIKGFCDLFAKKK